MISKLRAFGAFWYDFVIGDDWRVAVGVAVALGLTYGAAQADIPAWWIVPTALVLALPVSLWRATKPERRPTVDAGAESSP